MTYRFRPAVLGLIAVGTAALMLSGCGRKGPLDPPPVASAAPQQAAPSGAPAVDPSANPLGLLDPTPQEAAPVATPTGQRRIFLDRLLD